MPKKKAEIEPHFKMGMVEKTIWFSLIIGSSLSAVLMLIDHYKPFIRPIIHGLLNK